MPKSVLLACIPLVRKLELLSTLVTYSSSIPTSIYNIRVKTNYHYNNPSTRTFSHFRLSNCGVGEALYKVLHATNAEDSTN